MGSKIGPGPAKYLLKPTVGYEKHDLTKERKPMYSMGQRINDLKKNPGPSAIDFNIANMTRYGKKQANQSFMGTRLTDLNTNIGPGPAKYILPSTKYYKQQAPHFSMGQRLDVQYATNSPGPAKYMLPEVIGEKSKYYPSKGPMYSIRKKITPIDFSSSPGPAKYYPRPNESHKLHTSIAQRLNYTGGTGSKPGPNQYNLQYYKPGKKGPQYTMGDKLDRTPALPYVLEEDNVRC